MECPAADRDPRRSEANQPASHGDAETVARDVNVGRAEERLVSPNGGWVSRNESDLTERA